MSNHAYIRPAGVWNVGTVITHGEFAAFDAAQVDSLSASGGTYSLVDQLVLGGAGLQAVLTGTSTLPSGATLATAVGSALTVGGTLTTVVGSISTFNGTAIFGGTASFNDITTFTSNAFFAGPWGGNGALVASGTSHLSGVATLDGGTIINNAVAFQSASVTTFFTGASVSLSAGTTLNIAGAVTIPSTATVALGAVVAASGIGRVRKRLTYISGTGSDSSAYGPENADVVFVQALSADVTFTIDDTGAGDGDEMTFVNKSATNTLHVADPSAGTILSLRNVSTNAVSVRVMRVAGQWTYLSYTTV